MGSPDQLVDRIGEYVDAGADQINIAMRAPWQLELLDLATEAIGQLRTGVRVQAWAPGRVNLIGDHTDHTGGLVLPDGHRPRHDGRRRARRRRRSTLRSAAEPEPAVVPLDVEDPAAVSPGWARYVAGRGRRAAAVGRVRRRGDHDAARSAPGCRRRAALEVAVALALGFDGIAARAGAALPARRAASVGRAVRDHGPARVGGRRRGPRPAHRLHVARRSSRCRCPTTSRWSSSTPASGARWRRAPTPSGPPRARPPRPRSVRCAEATLGRRRAHRRRRSCAAGPATSSPRTQRVDAFAAALRSRRPRRAARDAMAASHASLRDDFEVSTPALDALVERARRRPTGVDRRPAHRRRVRRVRRRAGRARDATPRRSPAT